MAGFIVIKEDCINCKACEVTCKIRNDVPIGVGVRRRQVIEIEEGEFPNVTKKFVSMACMHCEKPFCEIACPVKAISKRADGVVLNDKDRCIGCGYCGWACPFGAPQYPETGDLKGIMDKCTYCVIPFHQKDEAGNPIIRPAEPACGTDCTTGALQKQGDGGLMKKVAAARKM